MKPSLVLRAMVYVTCVFSILPLEVFAQSMGKLISLSGNNQQPGAIPYSSQTRGGNPEPEAIRELFFTGTQSGEFFSISLAAAGDVNGDGYSDMIAGAYTNDAGGTDAGRAYIYFGGSNVDQSADVTLTGEAVNDLFGWVVKGAGDVNGDGYADVVVSSPNHVTGVGQAGVAYIYFGGMTMDNVADVEITSASTAENFAFWVSGAGDFNGDGYSDIIVGAPTSTGKAYIYYGGPNMNASIDVILLGGDTFGVTVSSIGDMNSDGYDDVIVGSRELGGSAFVYFGSPFGGVSQSDLTLRGFPGGKVGEAVAGGGDVNGDGYADAFVGAYGNVTNHFGPPCRAYIYFGGVAPDSIADVTIAGIDSMDGLGVSVSSAGDFNGDGYSDVIAGAYRQGNDDAGRAYVYFGGVSMDSIADVVFLRIEGSDRFGSEVAGVGDVDGDGYDDILVGDQHYNGGQGRAFLYRNSLTGTDVPDEAFTGEASGDVAGGSVSAGDVNGDGFDDVILGAPLNDAGGTDAGRAYICFGGDSLDYFADVILTGAAADDRFGWSTANAGDVNQDGYTDVIVGAYQNDAGGSNAGQSYIFFGGAGMDSIADVTLTGVAATDYFGWSVAGAGDVNGDGYSDVIVGAHENDAGGAQAGQAYIFFGGASMNSTADVTLTGLAPTDFFGYSVAGAGDVNRDGYADVIVGAYLNDAGGTDAGRAYIFFGGAAMDNTADLTVTGAAGTDWFGRRVAGAGDANGDGFSDVIVGAIQNDAGGTDAGRAYIYFGEINMDNTPDITLTGVAAGDWLGFAVNSAGDVNRDGYGDVIVGAYQNDAGGISAGRAYMYFGGAAMDNAADITLTGVALNNNFGYAVASAGDVNGDQFGDVLVGAPGNDANGTDAGQAYLYMSSSPPIVPRITSIGDVPNDQGGSVWVRWIRSGYDVQGISRVTAYLIERSIPPGTGGFAWEEIATVAAHHNPQYMYTAMTPYDSASGISGTFYFRVTAVTSNPNEYWRSQPASGHSVDNLSPGTIPSLATQVVSGPGVQLTWPRNTSDPDLGVYVIYRSTTSGFPLADSTRIGTSADTTFLDSSLPSASIVYYRVSARDIHANEGGPSPQASASLITTQFYGVNFGWNIISVPLMVSDYGKTTLYPTSISSAFAYQGGYVAQSTLDNGVGYWLKFPTSQSVSMTGFGRTQDTVGVQQGWNMIGSLSIAVAASTITSIPSGIISSPFFGFTNGYISASVIDPGRGYWVKTIQSGQLVLSAAASAPLAKAPEDLLIRMSRLTLRDAKGREQTLYFGHDTSLNGDYYELPPVAPEGIFDARFASQSMVAVSDQRIVLSSANYPLQVQWEIKAGTSASLVIGDQSIDLTSDGTTHISHLMSHIALRLGSSVELPTEFALEQNHPNPFNPSTTIGYQLPEASRVTIKVFNVVGQEVATLVDDIQSAGVRGVEFNAANIASGVYHYRITATAMETGASFTSVRKLIVLK